MQVDLVTWTVDVLGAVDRTTIPRRVSTRAEQTHDGLPIYLPTEKTKRSVAPVCLSVRLFPLYLLNRLTFELHFVSVYVGHDHSSPGIESLQCRLRLELV